MNRNLAKRGRGRGRMSKRVKDATEVVCKNRLTTKALYDTDGEVRVLISQMSTYLFLYN
jgi:hypothetical protein